MFFVMLDCIQKLIITHVFFALFQVLVQYGVRRKVLVVDGTFPSTVKQEFEIDSAETLVFQEYDDEWGKQLDINEVDLVTPKAGN